MSLRTVVGVAVAVVAVVGGGVLFWIRWRATPLPPVRPSPSEDVMPAPVGTKPSWIDGRTLLPDAQQPRAVAVSVDNAPEARPQTGIADATLVFEVPVEGQRTRFLAVFAAYTPADIAGEGYGGYFGYRETVGPIRSVRPYCIGIANALGVPIVHAGGSPAAMALLKNTPHVDEWYDAPFTRSRKRVPPFNLYATIADLAEYLSDREQRGATHADTWKLWGYTPTPFDGEQNGTNVALQYGGERAFDVSWMYDTAQDVYVRSQGGKIHRDIDGDAVTAKNVVVLRVESTVLDRVGRLAISHLDAGRAEGSDPDARFSAVVYAGGQRLAGTWGWESPEGDAGLFGLRHEPLEGGDSAAMAPILLLPGTTWVEVANF